MSRGWGSVSIGERIRVARKGLNLTQGEFAERCGVVLKTQSRFERDDNLPGGAYLIAAAALGVDVNHVLTGRPGAANDVEGALLLRFRESSADVQGVVLRALEIPATGQKASSVAITGGEQGQVVAGNVSQREVTFNVGGKKRGAGK